MQTTEQHQTAAERDPANLHTPVLLERCLELLSPAITAAENPVVVDATLGMGGHTAALLTRFPQLTVVGLDRDREALELAARRLAPFGSRALFVHTVYDGIKAALARHGIEQVAGVLFDLGVSSLQLDAAERGFAYAQDAPLDMRMDQSGGKTAADILATASEKELRDLFHRYGDEPLAARYAAAIVRAREEAPVTRSQQLVDLLQDATPAALKNKRHPAKRVFQALRVAVNDELRALEAALPAALDVLQLSGRVVVLSYQSHEDRLVKQVLTGASKSTAPAGLPIELPEHQPQFKLLTRGAETASEEEQRVNPRAIPARLRAAERMRSAC